MTRAAALVAGCAAIAACSRAPAAPVFAAPVRVNDVDGGAGQSEPAIAVDATGRTLIAAWVDWTREAPHVRLAISTDGGASFGASRAVLDPDAAHPMGQADATVASAGGRFAIAWIGCRRDMESAHEHACDVFARTSADGGRSWSPPTVVGVGGRVLRGRPWLAVDGSRFALSWTELEADGTARWVLVREDGRGSFVPAHELGETSIVPVSFTREGPVALTAARSDGKARTVTMRLRTANGATLALPPFAPEAALFEYSTGSFAAAPDGEAWIALPAGDGARNDLLLHHRRAGAAGAAPVRSLRDGGSRVGFPWISRLPDGRFLAVWMEEERDGWRVRARLLGPATVTSRAADVSKASFRFQEASRTRNIGDFLGATAAGDAFWVVWSDTRDGDADVWIAKGAAPR